MDEIAWLILEGHSRADAAAADCRTDHAYDGWQPEGEVRAGMLVRAPRELHLDVGRTTFVGADPRSTDAVARAGRPWPGACPDALPEKNAPRPVSGWRKLP